MNLVDDFNARLKDAMKRRDRPELSIIRMVKSRFQLKMAETGADTLEDDAAMGIIATYVKQLGKSLPEYEKAGERGAENVARINYEIGYLENFLPSLLDEAATKDLVSGYISELGISDAGQIGRLMGAIMKEHKGKVDPALVKHIATEKLSPDTDTPAST